MTAAHADAKNHSEFAHHWFAGATSLFATIHHWRANLMSWSAGRRKYRRTIAELRSHTDRQLADIGIARWQIREVAKGSITNRDLAIWS